MRRYGLPPSVMAALSVSVEHFLSLIEVLEAILSISG